MPSEFSSLIDGYHTLSAPPVLYPPSTLTRYSLSGPTLPSVGAKAGFRYYYRNVTPGYLILMGSTAFHEKARIWMQIGTDALRGAITEPITRTYVMRTRNWYRTVPFGSPYLDGFPPALDINGTDPPSSETGQVVTFTITPSPVTTAGPYASDYIDIDPVLPNTELTAFGTEKKVLELTVVDLIPVEVNVRKKTESDTPPTGLCVKKADVITFDFNGSAPLSAFPLAASTVTWQIRQIRRDGTFTAWTAVPGNGCELDYNTPTPGIFQAKAIFTPPGGAAQEYQFKRRRDVPNAASSTGDVQDLHKKDAPDYFGVVDADWQLRVRDGGVANLGSTYYNQNDSCVIYEGESADPNLPKCNIFIYHKCNDAGATVPLVRQNGLGLGDPDLPPNAIDWWNDNSGRTDSAGRAIVTLPIPGWASVPDNDLPQPGWVVARPRLGEAPWTYHSHVGIVDYDGSWINAGSLTVNKYCHLTTIFYQPARFKRFTGN